MKLTITATLTTYNEEAGHRVDVTKNFEAELRNNGHLYCPEMITWAKNHEDRLSNLLWVEYTTDRAHKGFYSI